MLAGPITRRVALTALGALAFPSAVAVKSAGAEVGLRIRDIVVDVSRLRDWAGDLTAEWVQQELPGALARALAGHFAPEDSNGATLVAQIDYIYLSPTSGGTGKRGAFQDTLEGALILRGPRGGVAAETPLKAIMPYSPMSVDATLVVEGFHGRVVALADAFAGWAPRELGL
jgi:hypothetical protein